MRKGKFQMNSVSYLVYPCVPSVDIADKITVAYIEEILFIYLISPKTQGMSYRYRLSQCKIPQYCGLCPIFISSNPNPFTTKEIPQPTKGSPKRNIPYIAEGIFAYII